MSMFPSMTCAVTTLWSHVECHWTSAPICHANATTCMPPLHLTVHVANRRLKLCVLRVAYLGAKFSPSSKMASKMAEWKATSPRFMLILCRSASVSYSDSSSLCVATRSRRRSQALLIAHTYF